MSASARCIFCLLIRQQLTCLQAVCRIALVKSISGANGFRFITGSGLCCKDLYWVFWLYEPAVKLIVNSFSGRTAEDIEMFLNIFNAHHSLLLLLLGAIYLNQRALRSIASRMLLEAVSFSAVSILLLILSINNIVMSDYAAAMSPSGFMNEVKKSLPGSATLLQYRHDFYSSVYYSGRNVPFIGSIAALSAVPGEKFLLVQENELPELQKAISGITIISKSANRSANGEQKLLLLKVD